MILIFILAVVIIGTILIIKARKIPDPVNREIQNQAALLSEHVSFYQKLNKDQQKLFERKVTDFLAHIRIEGVETQIEDLDRVLVAASAVIPIFGFPEWKYHNLSNVILYPGTFDKDFRLEGNGRNTLGMVGDGYMNGQMLLSKPALRSGFLNSQDKENTGIHEFVHLLDKSDGATDGVPAILLSHAYVIPWLKMIHQEMAAIQKGKSDINSYAATNEAEFLAVVSEYFFERPELLQTKHPQIYEMMSNMFHQQPA